MSMFDWHASTSKESGSGVVSSYFWVYWAITLPLTLIVAFSWRLWWSWEKRNFDRDVRTEIENIEELGSWGSGRHPARDQIEKQSEPFNPIKELQYLRRRKKSQGNARASAIPLSHAQRPVTYAINQSDTVAGAI